MASRIITPYKNSNGYIQKCIPEDKSLEGIEFPSLDEFMENKELNIESVIKKELQHSIRQQYYEWYTWYTADEEFRKMLAPIVGSSYDKYYLPILYFPRFVPILDENTINNFTDNENLIRAGMALQNLNVEEKIIVNFLRKIPLICDWLELYENDITFNFSNIGYSPIFGLRIIDYGLRK